MSNVQEEVVITREFNASLDMVFKAFSLAGSVQQFWAPEGWSMPVCTLDFRPGGEWRYNFRNAEGQEHWSRATYLQIVPGKQIAYRSEFIDAQGRKIESLPSSVFTFFFEDLGGKTLLTVHVAGVTAADLEQMVAMGFKIGFAQSLDHLEQYLLKEKKEWKK